MTKIKKDIHGLYVRTDGRLYRPVAAIGSYTISHALNSKEDGTSSFSEGDSVKAKHRACTPFARVYTDTYEEWWHSHGEYLHKNSEDCWTPKE